MINVLGFDNCCFIFHFLFPINIEMTLALAYNHKQEITMENSNLKLQQFLFGATLKKQKVACLLKQTTFFVFELFMPIARHL